MAVRYHQALPSHARHGGKCMLLASLRLLLPLWLFPPGKVMG